MSNRTIILQTTHNGKTEQHSFECQVVIIGIDRNYVLDNTSQNLSDLVPGCKVFDDGVLYRIKEIWYSPDSRYAFLNVYRDLPV